jgi:type II secretory ATPase GspE/PulE/Tfp pilus assembly ATPase PilB-like protein
MSDIVDIEKEFEGGYKLFDKKLFDYLFEKGELNHEALKTSLLETRITNESLSNTLVRNGFVKQKDLIQIIIDIEPELLIREEVLNTLIPPEIMIDYKFKICAISTDKIYVAAARSEVQTMDIIKRYYPAHEAKFIPCDLDNLDEYFSKIEHLAHDDATTLLEKTLSDGLMKGASDIHILPNRDTYAVQYRILGVKYTNMVGAKEDYISMAAMIKDLAKMDLAEKRKPQDGGFQKEFSGRLVDFRVATVPTATGEIIVMRLLDPDKTQLNLNTLGIDAVEEWRRGSTRANGLCIICGPTGSGKTTTLNATVRELDRFGKSIFTVEDPVEYTIPYVGQVNINQALDLDFARAIKAFMRSDPDIIVVGEIRDEDTARNAIKAAETGHLVFATLHSSSIKSAVNRLRDIGVDLNDLKYVLRSVMSQTLLRTLCTSCAGVGCTHCDNKKYTNRTIVSEIKYFSTIKEVEHMMHSEEVTWVEIIENAYGKYKSGITDIHELIRVFGLAEVENIFKKFNDTSYDFSTN